MSDILSMSKSTMKLLFRNKAFLVFFIVLPIVATLILNIHTENKESGVEVKTLESMDEQIAYYEDFDMYAIKVYDATSGKIVDNMLEGILSNDVFQIFTVKTTSYSYEEVLESAENTNEVDRVGAIIIIKDNFVQQLYEGNITDSIEIYNCDKDDRFDMLTATVKNEITQWSMMAKSTDSESELVDAMKKLKEDNLKVSKTEVDSSKSSGFLEVNHKRTESLGYALIILLISFVMCGIMILSTIINEKNNLVLTRILLTKTNTVRYILSKLVVVIFTVSVQTVIAVASFELLVKNDLSYSVWQFIAIVFTQGMIFTTLAICVGMFFDSIMTASYITFILWMCSALLGGVYFDISYSTTTFRKIAMIMPERWAMKEADLFSQGDPMAIPVIVCVTAAYLIVLLIAGVIGLKVTKKE